MAKQLSQVTISIRRSILESCQARCDVSKAMTDIVPRMQEDGLVFFAVCKPAGFAMNVTSSSCWLTASVDFFLNTLMSLHASAMIGTRNSINDANMTVFIYFDAVAK